MIGSLLAIALFWGPNPPFGWKILVCIVVGAVLGYVGWLAEVENSYALGFDADTGPLKRAAFSISGMLIVGLITFGLRAAWQATKRK